MIVIAHRGASAYFKENTVKAFKEAFAMGAKHMETDVQRSKDGVLVLYHDYALPGGQNIKDTSFSELCKFEIPSIEELFSAAEDYSVKINLEIKNDGNLYPGIEKQLIDFLNSAKNVRKENLLLSSFDFETLQRVRAIESSIKIGVLTRSFDVNQPLSINAYGVHMSEKRINADIIRTCKANGLKTFVYTVNDCRRARELEAMGADGVFSDFPDLLSKNMQ